MLYRGHLAMCLFALITATSCRKEKTEVRSTPQVYIPHGHHPLISYMMMTHAITTAQYYPYVDNAWGAFIVDRLSGTATDTAGNAAGIDLSWEEANFTAYQDFYHTVAAVSLNNSLLQNYWFAPFLIADSTRLWDENAVNTWQVLDSNQATIMTASATGTFPTFTGTLPDSISRQSNFRFSFNVSNCSGADSGYVVIISDQAKLESAVVSGNGGTAVIAAQRLQGAQNLFFGLPPHSVLWGGILKIVLFNHNFQTINGKRYVFVNEREILGKVVFH
ncbi:MAG: hypothetical protein JSS82_06100 [Bacteroidetes bacterium]|nr:hypothetical protein [Bacteroidota bacterium]